MATSNGTARSLTVTGPDGKKVSLASLPLVAFQLNCGHVGKDFAIQTRDIVFCDDCGQDRRVKKIIAG